ncbi:uncharacterized protein ASPGLDRAFT_1514493 [Aspergillus glaucus CBS 516.65]|uniref:Uncharacterized protein n=1 Tax=Aspergillus glaucus CBS 516.65 TaxID=1160497 RepID=A0A1L9VP30_ASPGL|nr:hypothetical protein ASPGLDRAFT_1514493 [Aspergillus glaucus CBS 516.65]OJJ85659.1 hypothetical protein ASPGLDRAFT_1514493 [Aspergillus glaucus CBS 516.65]
MLLSIPHSLGPFYQLDPGNMHPSIRVNPGYTSESILFILKPIMNRLHLHRLRFPSFSFPQTRKLFRYRTRASSNVANNYFQYRLIEGVERLEGYHAGGYHPVKIGDCLHNHYHIYTSWALAHTQQYGWRETSELAGMLPSRP